MFIELILPWDVENKAVLTHRNNYYKFLRKQNSVEY